MRILRESSENPVRILQKSGENLARIRWESTGENPTRILRECGENPARIWREYGENPARILWELPKNLVYHLPHCGTTEQRMRCHNKGTCPYSSFYTFATTHCLPDRTYLLKSDISGRFLSIFLCFCVISKIFDCIFNVLMYKNIEDKKYCHNMQAKIPLKGKRG